MLKALATVAAAVLVMVATNMLMVAVQGEGSVNWNIHPTVVTIQNDLSPNTQLFAHCQSADGHDLGVHYIRFAQNIHWSFRVNRHVTTLYSCAIRWNNLPQKNITVYDAAAGEGTVCLSKCIRSVKTDGVYFFNEIRGTWDKRYSF
ncbi:Plant self-incompatibility protein S1 [Sesbania bispinosa]|nr:Plant self-incompatibility protein S1 [Sesbania bispinosa]